MKNAIGTKIFALALFALLSLVALSSADSGRVAKPGSLMKISVLDADSNAAIPANLSVRIEYAAPDQARNYNYSTPVSSQGENISISFPPPEYKTTAHIRATAAGYYDSDDEFTVTSGSYWNNVQSSAAADTSNWGADVVVGNGTEPEQPPVDSSNIPLLAEHTFKLKKKPPVYPFYPDNYSKSNGICGLPVAALLAVLGCAVLFSRRK